MTPLRNLLFILLFAGFVSGCASIRAEGDRQAVLINSSPQGAEILVDGEAVGITPKYVEIRRSMRPAVELRYQGRMTRVPLERTYRWGRSFFGNLGFFSLAPIGWTVDLLTGTAWDVSDSPIVSVATTTVSNTKAPQPPARARKFAIAPPLADSLALSDAAGRALEQSLINTKDNLQPYSKTLPVFVANHYDYDGAPELKDRRDLYHHLGADVVYESKIERIGDQLVLRARPRDVLTKELGEPIELKFEPEGEMESIYSGGRNVFQALPNTLALDFVSEKLTWERDKQLVELVPAKDEAWYSKGLTYVNAITLSNLPERRMGRASRWQLTFVPTLRLSRREVEATGIPEVEGQKFVRWWASIGYGPELGFQISRHYLYLNVIPQAYWSQISWHRDGRDFTQTGTNIAFRTEVGYLFFINSNWNIRLFTRVQPEDTEGWETALSRSSSLGKLGNASLTTAGLSIGYRFEPRFSERRWLRPKSQTSKSNY